jgi:hypothetical protein
MCRTQHWGQGSPRPSQQNALIASVTELKSTQASKSIVPAGQGPVSFWTRISIGPGRGLLGNRREDEKPVDPCKSDAAKGSR